MNPNDPMHLIFDKRSLVGEWGPLGVKGQPGESAGTLKCSMNPNDPMQLIFEKRSLFGWQVFLLFPFDSV